MKTQYKNPHEMTPQEILAEAEKLHLLGDLGAAFFYDTIAMSLEGVMIAQSETKHDTTELMNFHKRASDLGHYLGSLIDADLAERARKLGILIKPGEKTGFMIQHSPYYKAYRNLTDLFQNQNVSHSFMQVTA